MREVRLGLGALTVPREETHWWAAVLGLTTLAAGVFVFEAFRRWTYYETSAYDLGFFDQIIHNTANGRLFETTFTPYNFLGQHVEPVLLFFVPAYWLGAGPLFLMAVQNLAAAVAAVPLYGATRRFGLPGAVCLAVAAAYLLNPYLHRGVTYDFHPEVMGGLFAFSSLWAIAAGRRWLAVGFALAPLLLKEDAAFVCLALAAVMWLRGSRREAVATAAIATACAAVAVLVVMPLARDGTDSDLLERYGYLAPGREQGELVIYVVTHPWVVVRELVKPGDLWTAALLIGVSAPLSVGKPQLLILMLPGLAVALLSSHEVQAELRFQYGASIAVTAVVIGVAGAVSLRRFPRVALAAAALAPAIVGFSQLSPFATHDHWGPAPSDEHREALAVGLALIPDDDGVAVSAQSSLLPRLSQRRTIYEFPAGWRESEWVAIDANTHRSGQSSEHFDENASAVREEYERVYARDGVEIFRRLE